MPTIDNNDINLAGVKPDADIVPENLDLLYQLFLYLVTFMCIIGTVEYWALLMGISNDGAFRFDIAPLHWQIVEITLALLMPLTALGIWFRNLFGLWGWILITVIHCFMHGVMSDQYGEDQLYMLGSIIIALLFLAFKFLFYRREKERQKEQQR